MKKCLMAVAITFSAWNYSFAEMIDLKEMNLGVLEPVRSIPEFENLTIKLNICCALQEKKDLERALKADMQYSKKYGVINYSRRDEIVQRIKFDDALIAESKRDYKAVFGKSFTPSVCKKESCENPSMKLMAFAKELAEQESVIKINAPTLHYNYNKDLPRANDEYNGQILQVKGRISKIVKDDNGEIRVMLKTKDELHPLQAFINSSDVSISESLVVGNGVEVRCEGAGMTDEGVILKKCSFVEQKP